MIDPLRIFQIKGEVSQLYTATVALTVANNQQVVAAVSGKRIRVMGWKAQTIGAAVGSVSLKSASGGTVLTSPLFPPINTGGLTDNLPVIESGYFETNTGEGLFADCATTTVTILVFYFTYTP